MHILLNSHWVMILSFGVKSVPYVWWVILTCDPVKGGIVHSYENGFLDRSGKVLPLPSHSVKVVMCDCVACGEMVALYR